MSFFLFLPNPTTYIDTGSDKIVPDCCFMLLECKSYVKEQSGVRFFKGCEQQPTQSDQDSVSAAKQDKDSR